MNETHASSPEGLRIVLDTNVLVAAARTGESDSRRIVEACRAGDRLLAVVSDALRREYEFVLPRALRDVAYYGQIVELIQGAQNVPADARRHRASRDPDDDKLLAAAVASQAAAIVTADQHLLELDPYQGVRIVRPAVFVQAFLE